MKINDYLELFYPEKEIKDLLMEKKRKLRLQDTCDI